MSMSTTLNSREWNKFQETSPGETAVRVASVDDRVVVQSMDVIADWTVLNVATTGLAADVDHKEGQYSVEFDKAADAAITTAGVYASPDSLNLTRYNQGKIRYWINLSSLANVAKVSLRLGTDSSNYNVYETADTLLATGWNELIYDGDSPTSVTGNGIIWGDVDYIAIFVTFDAAGDTLADIRVDAITVYNPMHIELVAQDIEIGAVELKDASTDNRANILAANTARTTGTIVVATQQVGADGTVPPTGSLLSNAPFAKITDGTSNLTLGTGTTKTVPAELNDGTTKIVFGTGTTKTVPSAVHDGTTMATVTTGTIKGLNAVISDGTTIPAVLTGTTKTLATSIHDGTSLLTLGTGTTKTVPAELNDGTTKIVFGTGTQKTVPTAISDGTTEVDVIATINALKSDLSSVAGSTTPVSATHGLRVDNALASEATHYVPNDGAATFTSNVTITCSGLPFTVEDASCYVVYIDYFPTGSTFSRRLVNGVGGVSMKSAANVITVAGAGTPFAASDTYYIGFRAQRKAFDAAGNNLRTAESNPLNLQVVEGSLFDTTNVAAAATYYPSSLGMAMLGYKNFSISFKYIDAHAVTTTLSVQGTNDEDTTNADWVNIQGQVNGLASATVAIPTITGTVAGVTGVAVVPGTVADLITTAAVQTVILTWDFDVLNYRYIRVVLTPGDATNTAIGKYRLSY